jgi:hypothetical protein
MSDGNLDLLLEDIAARLTDSAFFGEPGEAETVCVVKDGGRRESGLTEDEIAYELSRDYAAVVVVSIERGKLVQRNVAGPYVEVTCLARVLRNPTTSSADTNASALEIAEKVAVLWHQYKPSNGASMMSVAEDIEPFVRDDGRVLARVRASCHVAFFDSGLTQVATPVIAIVDNGGGSYTATITCATAGAAIFYATGTGKPTPLEGTLYSTGVSLSSGDTIRARAYLAGYVRSETAATTV